MARLALYTFGVLHEAAGQPAAQASGDALPSTMEVAAAAPGFIAADSAEKPWGDADAHPRVYDHVVVDAAKAGSAPLAVASTLSIWRDLEAAYAFACSVEHGDLASRSAEWLRDAHWPSYVGWWIGDHEQPMRQAAVQRLEHLHDDGPTAYAFNFEHPFDVFGRPAVLHNVTAAKA